ncbi:MAG: 30S ribosomal protein S16 [Acidimicrobiia bacterium]|nr:30S ribosomal protein S16 [Acidimicrobiia bacterium]
MAVKIRLMRVGKKKQPTYRVVVADVRSPRDGRFIEILGHYSPRQEPSEVVIDGEKAVAWLQKGAQPTDQVARLLEIAGVWDAFETATGRPAKMKPKPRTPKPKTEKAPAAAAPAAEVPAAAALAAEAPAEDTPTEEAAPAEDAPTEEAAPAEESGA